MSYLSAQVNDDVDVMMIQVEMKSQKDELQRQRDALQRQIDLFEEQRRHWLTGVEHRTSRPDVRPHLLRRSMSPSTDPASNDSPEVVRVRNSESGSEPAARHLCAVGQGGGVALARVSSAGNVAALDSRTMTRFGSVGSLSSLRRDSKPVPVHLMSKTNESRLGSSTSNHPLRSTTSLPTQPCVQQIIPTKLSANLSKALRDQRGVVDMEKTRAPASAEKSAAGGGHVGSRDSPRAAEATSGNILPMKLAEGHHREPSRSSTSTTSVRSALSFAGAAADDPDDDGGSKDDVFKAVDKDDEAEVLYF